jgi:hypothetical protein
MDTKKLSLFLDENTNYDKSSNKIFIDKLLNLSSYHNFFGDTKLMYLPGSNGIDEFVNEHCNRFTFVNNDSTRHITVIFEENEVRVTGAYESWNSKGYSLDSTYFKRFYLTKQSDQINAFDFSIDYLLKVEKCNAAINEISSEETNYLHKADYVDWINKYEHLKDEQYGFLFYPFLQLENFNYLFFILSQYKFYVELNDDCIKANQEYIVTDISNEDELLKWLIKFEKLGNSLDAIKETPLNIEDNEEEFETGFVTVHDKLNIKIAVGDFKKILKFFDNFFTPYFNMCEKYGEVDNTEINEDFVFPVDYKSLQELVNERRQRS